MNTPSNLSPMPNPNEDSLKKLLKRAVSSEPVPAHLEARVRASLRETGESPLPNRLQFAWLWPALASAAALAVIGFFLLKPSALPSRQERLAYITRVSNRVSSIMRVGLGDHIHCAVFRQYPAQAPSVDQMRAELTAPYASLLDVVKKHAPSGYGVAMAHKCHFEGREFIHLVLRRRSDVISLVVATRMGGERFQPETLIQGLSHAGIPMYRQTTDDFQITAFESKNHLVYLISTMSPDQNNKLMASMSHDIGDALPAI